jgi:hypothetical protein
MVEAGGWAQGLTHGTGPMSRHRPDTPLVMGRLLPLPLHFHCCVGLPEQVLMTRDAPEKAPGASRHLPLMISVMVPLGLKDQASLL